MTNELEDSAPSGETRKKKKNKWRKAISKGISHIFGEVGGSSENPGSNNESKVSTNVNISIPILTNGSQLSSNYSVKPENADIPGLNYAFLNDLATSLEQIKRHEQIDFDQSNTPGQNKSTKQVNDKPEQLAASGQIITSAQINNLKKTSVQEQNKTSEEVENSRQLEIPRQVNTSQQIENQKQLEALGQITILEGNSSERVKKPVQDKISGQVENFEKSEDLEQSKTLERVKNLEQIETSVPIETLRQADNLEQLQVSEEIVTSRHINNLAQPKDLREFGIPINVKNARSHVALSYPILEVEDNFQYKFYPVPSGSVHFKVRASNDAHIALAMGREEDDPRVEVIIGGWGNTKSSISRYRTTPTIPATRSIEVNTPGVLSSIEFRGFWVRWDCGVVSTGLDNNVNPFMSWCDPDPFNISYIGFRSAWKAKGVWKIKGGDEIITKPDTGYIFKPCTIGFLEFEYRGLQNCCVCLTHGPTKVEPLYEIILGGSKNPRHKIRYKKRNSGMVTVDTVKPSNFKTPKKFSIEWQCGKLEVRLFGDVIMTWTDPTPFPITHFGVRMVDGDWRFKHFPTNWHTLQH